MKAKIFQLEPVKKDEYKDSGYRLLNSFSFDDRLVFPDPTMIDWWCDAEDIKGSFSKLVSDLPNGGAEILACWTEYRNFHNMLPILD